jgi:hypothetical protein
MQLLGDDVRQVVHANGGNGGLAAAIDVKTVFRIGQLHADAQNKRWQVFRAQIAVQLYQFRVEVGVAMRRISQLILQAAAHFEMPLTIAAPVIAVLLHFITGTCELFAFLGQLRARCSDLIALTTHAMVLFNHVVAFSAYAVTVGNYGVACSSKVVALRGDRIALGKDGIALCC